MAKKNTPLKVKKSRGEADSRLSCCYGCYRPFSHVLKACVQCCCTEVVYCSENCQALRSHDDCPGRQKLFTELTCFLGTRDMPLLKTNLCIVYTDPVVVAHLLSIPLSPRNLTAEYAAKLGGKGKSAVQQSFLCLAGIRYTLGLFGPYRVSEAEDGRILSDNSQHRVPTIQAQKIGFKLLYSAAILGNACAMQSLGECYIMGSGCRVNVRYGNQWAWRASLKGFRKAFETLDDRALVTRELKSIRTGVLEAMNKSTWPKDIDRTGSNLASLLLAFHDVLKKGQSLPPFAGIFPSGKVGQTTCNGRSEDVRVVGAANMKLLLQLLDEIESKGNKILLTYRRGNRDTSARCVDSAPRWIDSPRYIVPPAPGCEETVTEEQVNLWTGFVQMSAKPIRIACAHIEQGQDTQSSVCPECIAEAKDRLWAVSHGKVALSENEPRREHGHIAIYQGHGSGQLHMETWKAYSSSEAECVLAVLVASGEQIFQTPLFVAQDPNLFWPLIFDHGSIRAALEFVAPHINWTGVLGHPKCPPPLDPLVKDGLPGVCLIKCGNDLCCGLSHSKSKSLLGCSRCFRRTYCSKSCQKADWAMHKHECSAVCK